MSSFTCQSRQHQRTGGKGMNIVNIIDQHTFALKHAVAQASIQQRKSLVKAIFNFYAKLPDFEKVIAEHYQIHINQTQLFDDIEQDNLSTYWQQIQQANASIDEYADDYEEQEALVVNALDAFALMVADQAKVQALVALFSMIIELLDYYANFADNATDWQLLLEKEIAFQQQIFRQIAEKCLFDSSVYCVQYQNVEFTVLDA